MEQLINITDAVFLGHVGEVELGASAIAGIYYLAVYMLGFGFSIGLQVMIARRNGECDYGKAGKIFFQGFFFLSGLAILLCLYNPQIQISAESETKRSIFREKDKTKRSKKESAQHSKSRNKSFVMTSVSAL